MPKPCLSQAHEIIAAFLQYADKIIVLDNGGRISDQGDFNSLTKSSSYIQKLLETEQSAHTPTNAFASSTASGTSTTTTTTEKHATRKNTELTEGNENNSPKSHALSHYISSMGLTGIISFVSLVLLHIGCSTAQRKLILNTRKPNTCDSLTEVLNYSNLAQILDCGK